MAPMKNSKNGNLVLETVAAASTALQKANSKKRSMSSNDDSSDAASQTDAKRRKQDVNAGEFYSTATLQNKFYSLQNKRQGVKRQLIEDNVSLSPVDKRRKEAPAQSVVVQTSSSPNEESLKSPSSISTAELSVSPTKNSSDMKTTESDVTSPYVCVPTIVPVSPIRNSSPPSPNTDFTSSNPQIKKISADSDSIDSDSIDSDSNSSDSDSDSSDSDSDSSDSDSSDSDSDSTTSNTARSITPTNENTTSNNGLSIDIAASSPDNRVAKRKRNSGDVTSSSESGDSDSSVDMEPSEPKNKKKTAVTYSVSLDVTEISNKTKTGPLTKLNGVFRNKDTFKALREQMELRNQNLRDCRTVTTPLRDEWTPNTQYERFDGRKVVIRRPADWIPGTEYKPFVSGYNAADSNTMPFPRPKLWHETMELHKKRRLSNDDSKKEHTSSATM